MRPAVVTLEWIIVDHKHSRAFAGVVQAVDPGDVAVEQQDHVGLGEVR